jgi:hypothetical protein
LDEQEVTDSIEFISTEEFVELARTLAEDDLSASNKKR